MLSKVLSLDYLSCPQIWNTEEDKEREKVGDRPAKFNEEKSDRQLEEEIKDKGDIFLLEEQHENFVAAVQPAKTSLPAVKSAEKRMFSQANGGGKIRNTSGHQGEHKG